jgi:fructokinase
MYDVLALGELLVDFTPNNVNDQGMALFARNPGGAPANVLAMLSRLKTGTAFLGKVGRDDFGRFLARTLKDAGIDITGLLMDPIALTTLAFVQLNEQGDRSFSFYRKDGADLMLRPEELKLDLIDQGKIFHFGAVSLTGEPCRSAVHAAVKYALKQGKIISYDPNYRPLLWTSPEKAKTEISRLIDSADILKVSEEEMVLLTGEEDLEKGAAKLRKAGPSIVLVSLGPKGAYFSCGSGAKILPTYNVQTIDTTGAGDAFLGAVLFRIRNKTKEELRDISCDELADIVDFANAAGSLTTAKKGAIPAMPSLEEIGNCQKTGSLIRETK